MSAVNKAGALGITARGLSKSFAGRRVIADLDLHVPAGQFLAIVGRSGCGKSTLLRLLAGLETPDAGTVRFGDAPATPERIRLMFQEPRLLPWARVADNVAVGLGREGETRAGRDSAVAALAEVGLADRAEHWPATCPVVKSSGSRWLARWCRSHASSPSTSRLGRSTR